MRKSILLSAAKYGLGIGLLAFVIWKNWSPPAGSSAPGLGDALRRPIQVVALALAMSIALSAALLSFVRWYLLVRAQELPFTLTNALRLGMIGFFFNNFLPGNIGGDLIKAAFLAREQKRRTVAVATVLLDRAIGLWGLVWLVALSGGLFWALGNPEILRSRPLQSIVLSAAVLVVATVVVWLLLGVLPEFRAQRFAGRLSRIPKVGHSASEFWRALWMYRCQRRIVALTLLMAMVGHTGNVLLFFCAAQIFQEPSTIRQMPTLEEHFLLVPIGMSTQSLLPSPGGMGVGEYVFGELYAMIDENWRANGVLGSLGQHAVYWILGFTGYLVYLRMKPALRQVVTEIDATELATVEA